MSVPLKTRHTLTQQSTSRYPTYREVSLESDRHYSDYYTFTDMPSKKKKAEKKSREIKVGSLHEHAQSLQRLQIVIDNRNKQIMNLVKDISNLKSENELLKGKLWIPQNEKEQSYIKELEMIQREISSLAVQDKHLQAKHQMKLEKLTGRREQSLQKMTENDRINKKPSKALI